MVTKEASLSLGDDKDVVWTAASSLPCVLMAKVARGGAE